MTVFIVSLYCVPFGIWVLSGMEKHGKFGLENGIKSKVFGLVQKIAKFWQDLFLFRPKIKKF